MKKQKKRKSDIEWIVIVTILAFIIALIMSLFGEVILSHVGLLISIIITLIFIMLGIIFDVIGVATTAADIHVFNSMSSKKVKGASTSVKLINNKNRVSSICCDVVGDVCGVISGSSGVAIATILILDLKMNTLLVSALITAFVSMFTIGGKAICKGYAIKNSTAIVHRVGIILAKLGFK